MRKIIHVDMDAFYASVEQRDRPELRGKPVIVGGDPRSRGVVAACSYEARRFGIHSAMAASHAFRLCPEAVFLRPRFAAYHAVSDQIRAIFLDYTDLVEPLSLDEAYLDVTCNKKNIGYATAIAREIRSRIHQDTRLTASAGVSFNKFLAKVASDFNKPDGLTVVTPEQAQEFIDRLPIGKFHGIGKVTEKKMLELGVKTGADLRRLTREELAARFGKFGEYYYEIARGIDERPVEPEWERKSLGKETTLAEDILDRNEMLAILTELAEEVAQALAEDERAGRTVTLKVKYFDFVSITRSVTLPAPVTDAGAIMAHVPRLLDATDAGRKKIRLLGITVSNFIGPADESSPAPHRPVQLKLPFD